MAHQRFCSLYTNRIPVLFVCCCCHYPFEVFLFYFFGWGFRRLVFLYNDDAVDDEIFVRGIQIYNTYLNCENISCVCWSWFILRTYLLKGGCLLLLIWCSTAWIWHDGRWLAGVRLRYMFGRLLVLRGRYLRPWLGVLRAVSMSEEDDRICDGVDRTESDDTDLRTGQTAVILHTNSCVIWLNQ